MCTCCELRVTGSCLTPACSSTLRSRTHHAVTLMSKLNAAGSNEAAERTGLPRCCHPCPGTPVGAAIGPGSEARRTRRLSGNHPMRARPRGQSHPSGCAGLAPPSATRGARGGAPGTSRSVPIVRSVRWGPDLGTSDHRHRVARLLRTMAGGRGAGCRASRNTSGFRVADRRAIGCHGESAPGSPAIRAGMRPRACPGARTLTGVRHRRPPPRQANLEER
jgi:hypothetical protein